MASHSRYVAALLLTSLALFITNGRAGAIELLENGGFESGKSGWAGSGVSATGCEPRSGSGALRLGSGAGGTASTHQGAPVQAGESYEFSGYARLQLGDVSAQAQIIWLNVANSTLSEIVEPIEPGDDWDGFSIEGEAPSAATTARVRVIVDANEASEVCLDDLAFEGPEQLPPTATLAPTLTPTTTPTQPPATAVPTQPPPSNPPPTTGVSPPASPGAPSATTGGVAAFTNGGFEAGLAGWRKYGGELTLVSSPVHAGGGAGALTSATTSTKWAFQLVPVDASQNYEFSGWLATAGATSEAFLRISFYASADGSGSAMATVDSTARVYGANGAYTFLTTGPVTPPPGALTARPRVLLTPQSAAPATVYLDDLAFGVTTAAPVQSASPTAPAPSQPSGAASSGTSGGRPTGSAATGLEPVPLGSPQPTVTATAVAEVRGALEMPPETEARAPVPLLEGSAEEGFTVTPAAAGLGMLVLAGAFGSAYLLGQRSAKD